MTLARIALFSQLIITATCVIGSRYYRCRVRLASQTYGWVTLTSFVLFVILLVCLDIEGRARRHSWIRSLAFLALGFLMFLITWVATDLLSYM
jgi:hypothetical protein